jgi:replication factor A1
MMYCKLVQAAVHHPRRDLTLVDDSRKTVAVTLWREQAETTGAQLEAMDHPVVMLTKLRVTDFNGISLSSTYHTTVEVNPDSLAEADVLQNWWATTGSGQTFAPAGDAPVRVGSLRSKWQPLESLVLEREGVSADDKPEYASLNCVLALVPDEQTLYYEANTANNKKVCSCRMLKRG